MSAIQRSIVFPQIAREAGIRGVVICRVLVGPDGSYRDYKVINSSHPLLQKLWNHTWATHFRRYTRRKADLFRKYPFFLQSVD